MVLIITPPVSEEQARRLREFRPCERERCERDMREEKGGQVLLKIPRGDIDGVGEVK